MNIIYLTADWLLAGRNMLTMWAYTSFVSFYLACKIYFPCCESTSAPVSKLSQQLCVKVSFCIFHGEHAHLFIQTETSLKLNIIIHIYFDTFFHITFFTRLGQQSSLVHSCLGITPESAVKRCSAEMRRSHVALGELIPGKSSPYLVEQSIIKHKKKEVRIEKCCKHIQDYSVIFAQFTFTMFLSDVWKKKKK